MMKTMKKYSILMGAVLGLSALVSCQKEADVIVPEENAVAMIPFVLKAQVPETKTTIDADTWQVAWENGDIVYAVTTDEEWGEAYVSADETHIESIAEFICEDNTFTTTKTISEGEHTFNFLYTANASQKTYHRGAGTSYSLASSQTEDATAPTAALKMNDALVGQVTVVAPADFVKVPMNHLFTLMKVTLKNKTANELTVSKFEMKASDAVLAGIYNVSFSETPSIELKLNDQGKPSSSSDHVSVVISNGTIAANDELPVYFVMAPLSNYSGDITFKVTDSENNTYTKTNAVSGVTFNAGEYNTASFSLKSVDPVECVALDWTYPEEGEAATSEGINAIPGVVTKGLGSDYAANNAPYCIKFDTNDDYIQVRTDKAIGSVSVKYKMLGGSTTSKLEIYESTNGSTWSKLEELAIAGAKDSFGEVITSAEFNKDSRVVKINFKKGSNVGIGGITIKQQNLDPVIFADNITGVAAVGGNGTAAYSVKNFTDDVEVSTVTGCVSSATASDGTITYSVSPNYSSSAADGTIVLVSASNAMVTKTVNVAQLQSSLAVSLAEVVIPANANTATFTVTTPEFGYTAVATAESNQDLTISSGSSGNASASAQTVTVSSTVEAPTSGGEIILGTVTVYRINADDPQKKTITVKKAVAGVKTYTLFFPDDNSGSNGISSYTETWTAKKDGLTWSITNFNNNNWNNWSVIKCGRKNYASVGTIKTDTKITEAISTVTVVVDAATVSKVNSFKLYVATDNSYSTNLQTISVDIAVGNNVFSVPTPTADCYYKLEVDCASGSSNGLVTISKIVYSTGN